MYFSTFATEHSVSRCDARLGDVGVSPTFHRVSALCPVLHLFGYITLTEDNGGEEDAPSAAPGVVCSAATAAAPSAALGPPPSSPPSASQRGRPAQIAACVHVHGAYPWFLVPQYHRRVGAAEFGAQLEAVALQRGVLPPGARDDQIIHSVELVRRVPVYGYHARARAFYRVAVIDARCLPGLRRLLEETAAVGGRSWQLYDAHVGYAAQFCAEHDIKGAAPFPIGRCLLRSDGGAFGRRGRAAGELKEEEGEEEMGEGVASEVEARVLRSGAVAAVLLRDDVPRRTRCAVELDVCERDLRGPATGTEVGEHLASLRRQLRRAARAAGVPGDALSRDTISAEAEALEADPVAAAASVGFARVGSVAAVQAADAGAAAMRAAVRSFLASRTPSQGPSPTPVALPRSASAVAPKTPFLTVSAAERERWADYVGCSPSSLSQQQQRHSAASLASSDGSGGGVVLTYALLDAIARADDVAAAEDTDAGASGTLGGGGAAAAAAAATALRLSGALGEELSDSGSSDRDDCSDVGGGRGAPLAAPHTAAEVNEETEGVRESTGTPAALSPSSSSPPRARRRYTYASVDGRELGDGGSSLSPVGASDPRLPPPPPPLPAPRLSLAAALSGASFGAVAGEGGGGDGGGGTVAREVVRTSGGACAPAPEWPHVGCDVAFFVHRMDRGGGGSGSSLRPRRTTPPDATFLYAARVVSLSYRHEDNNGDHNKCGGGGGGGPEGGESVCPSEAPPPSLPSVAVVGLRWFVPIDQTRLAADARSLVRHRSWLPAPSTEVRLGCAAESGEEEGAPAPVGLGELFLGSEVTTLAVVVAADGALAAPLRDGCPLPKALVAGEFLAPGELVWRALPLTVCLGLAAYREATAAAGAGHSQPPLTALHEAATSDGTAVVAALCRYRYDARSGTIEPLLLLPAGGRASADERVFLTQRGSFVLQPEPLEEEVEAEESRRSQAAWAAAALARRSTDDVRLSDSAEESEEESDDVSSLSEDGDEGEPYQRQEKEGRSNSENVDDDGSSSSDSTAQATQRRHRVGGAENTGDNCTYIEEEEEGEGEAPTQPLHRASAADSGERARQRRQQLIALAAQALGIPGPSPPPPLPTHSLSQRPSSSSSIPSSSLSPSPLSAPLLQASQQRRYMDLCSAPTFDLGAGKRPRDEQGESSEAEDKGTNEETRRSTHIRSVTGAPNEEPDSAVAAIACDSSSSFNMTISDSGSPERLSERQRRRRRGEEEEAEQSCASPTHQAEGVHPPRVVLSVDSSSVASVERCSADSTAPQLSLSLPPQQGSPALAFLLSALGVGSEDAVNGSRLESASETNGIQFVQHSDVSVGAAEALTSQTLLTPPSATGRHPFLVYRNPHTGRLAVSAAGAWNFPARAVPWEAISSPSAAPFPLTRPLSSFTPLLLNHAAAAAARRRRALGLCGQPALSPPPPLPQPQQPSVTPSRSRRSRSSTLPPGDALCTPRVMYVEVIVDTPPPPPPFSHVRRRRPRPLGSDPLLAVVLAHGAADCEAEELQLELYTVALGADAARPPGLPPYALSGGVAVREVAGGERGLLAAVVRAVLAADPDVLVSWDAYRHGLALLALRYRALTGGRNLGWALSRWRGAGESDLTVPEEGEDAEQGFSSGVGGADAGEEADNDREEEVSSDVLETASAALLAVDGIAAVAVATGGGESPEDEGEGSSGGDEREKSEGSGGGDGEGDGPAFAARFESALAVPGRVTMSGGKAFLSSQSLPSFALSDAVRRLLGRTLPVFTDATAAALLRGGDPGGRAAVLRHLCVRVGSVHRVARRLNVLPRMAEFSRMYGVAFESALRRATQFKVEATLLRVAWPAGYALLSASPRQVLAQPRIQHIPLVMEPRAGLFRESPVVVLDFRSLYPSVMIAYNLCFTTCLGLVQPHARSRLGVVHQYRQDAELLRELAGEERGGGRQPCPRGGCGGDDGRRRVIFSPNGAMFVSRAVREGVLPRMLRMVLDTRFEAQAAARLVAGPAGDAAAGRRLHEQQTALKMLANTTYGYTAASFTGRMPCVDLAEAIVSLGRQTLERAIALVHATPEWGAEVVYGDTDSLFVCLPGRSKSEAFDVGEAIARAVSADNPFPVRLQFEKVLLPCLLLVKKRYAGFAWASRQQTEPTFLAKGIETVRRDQCSATADIVGALLRRLLSGAAVPELRECYTEQVARLRRGVASPTAFIFRRAVKLGRYGSDASLPLAARLALRRMRADPAATPFWGERLAYVVACSRTSGLLRDQVRAPEALLYADAARDTTLDVDYYISRHINAALDRMLYVVEGASAARWGREMARRRPQRWYLWDAQRFLELYHAPLQRALARSRGGCGGGGSAATAVSSPRADAPVLTVHSSSDSDDDDGGAGASEVSSSADSDATVVVVVDVDGEEERRPAPQSVANAKTGTRATPAAGAGAGAGAGAAGAPEVARRLTLDAYYPQTLCVACGQGRVTMENQQRVEQRLASRLAAAAAADARGRPARSCLYGGGGHYPHRPGGGARRWSQAEVRALTALPPVCEACWRDPPALWAAVLARTNALAGRRARLMDVCRRCIQGSPTGSGGGDGASVPDMEDVLGGGTGWRGRCSSALRTFAAVPPSMAAAATTPGVTLSSAVSFSASAAVNAAPASAGNKNAATGDPGLPPTGIREGRRWQNTRSRTAAAATPSPTESVPPLIPPNPYACVCVDCDLAFEKAQVTVQEQQYRVLLCFLEVML